MSYTTRLSAPKTWLINRKENKYIVTPLPGKHAKEHAHSLTYILKTLGYAKTTREIKRVLLDQPLLIDGKRTISHKTQLGLFDTLTLPDKTTYKITLDVKGRLQTVPTKEILKPCKILKKTVRSKGRIQLNLYDGRNITLDKNMYAVGDTLVINPVTQEITHHLKLAKGARVILVKGKHSGTQGTVQDIQQNNAIISVEGTNEHITTLKTYLHVIPEEYLNK